MSDRKTNDEQIAYWNGQSGRKWAEDADKLDAMMRAAMAASLAAAGAAPGESVIDIGCGTGATSRALAEAVGADGKVLGVDISEPMLAVARDRAVGRGNLSYAKADAATHHFPLAGADLIFSKFGVMFFADPEAAFKNIHTAVKPHGRLAFVCWRSLAENPFATIPMGAALKHLPPQPKPDPTAPGPFALADPDRTRSILMHSGFHSPKLAEFDAEMTVGRTAAGAAKEAVLMGMASRLMMEASEETKQTVIAEATKTYGSHMTANGVTLPARMWVVTASG